MLAIWSLVPLPFLKQAWTSGISWFMYCWSLAWRILSMGDECNCVVVWTFFGISLLWDWNENWPFPVLWPLLSFKPAFHSLLSPSSRGSSSSSFSAIRVVSSVHLRVLVFLLAILIPVYASFIPAFLMMYSAYMLNKHGDSIQPWYTPFSIWNQSIVPCPVLTVASWLAYRFLRRQVR